MKYLTVTLLAAVSFIFSAAPISARAESPRYAMILDGCTLYRDAELTEPLTTLPKTYFVAVLDSSQAASVYVSYGPITGYANPRYLEACGFTPKNKFGSGELTLTNDGGAVNIRSSPDHTKSNVVDRRGDGATLNYFGSVSGTAQNSLIGTEWYAVDLGEGEIGYVYSMYAIAVIIPENVIEPEPEPEPPSVSADVAVDEKSSYFLIAALCLPVIVVMYLLFKAQPDKG